MKLEAALRQRRLADLRANMASLDLDCVAIVPGANFQFLTGGRFASMERPTILVIPTVGEVRAIVPALELVPHRRLIEPLAEPPYHVESGHDHARRAETALQPVILVKGLLHGMELTIRRQALYGGDAGAVGLAGEHGARFDGHAVDEHDAGAALRCVAADMGAGQAQMLAQELHQQGAGVDIRGDGIAVYDQGNLGHQHSLDLPAACRRSSVKISPKAIIWALPARGNLAGRGAGYDLTFHRLGEIGEELVGQLLGRAIDQALAELGQLAADLRLDIIA